MGVIAIFLAFRTNLRKRKLHENAHRGRYSEAEVEARLADAGRVLLALPWANCFPFGLRTLWPETEVDASARRPIPSSDQIRAMDQAYRWTALIAKPEERRLVLMRSLVLPVSASGRPRYVWSWRRLQRATGFHRDTLKERWGRGIGHIVDALNRPTPASWPPFGRDEQPLLRVRKAPPPRLREELIRPDLGRQRQAG